MYVNVSLIIITTSVIYLWIDILRTALRSDRKNKKENHLQKSKWFIMSALPIFPGGCPPSIFGTFELNYRVRDGNGWTLKVINTDYAVMDCTTDFDK